MIHVIDELLKQQLLNQTALNKPEQAEVAQNDQLQPTLYPTLLSINSPHQVPLRSWADLVLFWKHAQSCLFKSIAKKQ